MREAGILVLLLAVFAGKASSSICGDTFLELRGSITENTTAPAGKDCVFTISRNKTYTQTVLQIKKIALQGNDTLIVFDGKQGDNKTIIKYTAGSQVSSQLAVGFAENTTIVFKPEVTSTKSQFLIDYDVTECTLNLMHSYDFTVAAPLFVPTAGNKLNCMYTVTNELPPGQMAVVSVGSLQLDKGSSLILSSHSNNQTYNAASSRNDFFEEQGENMTITFNVPNTNSSQNFSLLVESVVADCSGKMLVNNGTQHVLRTFPDQPVNYNCRLQVKTSQSSLLARIMSLSVFPNSDKVVFIDGGSSFGSVLGSLTDSFDKGDYLVTSTQEYMTISLALTKIGPRSVNFTLEPAAYQSRLNEAGNLTVGNGTATPPQEAYFQLVAKENQVVKVEIEKDGNASVTCFNGLQTTDPVLAVVGGPHSQGLKTVIGKAQMLVKVAGLADTAVFKATFSSIPAGCDMLATGASGQLMYTADEALKAAQTCTWTIAPREDKGILVVDINSVLLEKETLTVYAGLDDTKILEQVTGPQLKNIKLPQLYVGASDKMSVARVVITRPATNSTRTKVSLQYQIVPQACGGNLNQPLNSLGTPNFPNEYPVNAQCVWMVDPTYNLTGFVHINFKSLSLAEGDFVNVTNGTGAGAAVLASYGFSNTSDQLPADLIIPYVNDTTVIQFQSVPKVNQSLAQQVSSGAEWDTRLLSCGGIITEKEKSFESPGYPKSPASSVYCLWIIEVKGKAGVNASVVNYTFSTTEGAQKELPKYLKIYDGNSLRTEAMAFNKSFTKPRLSYLKQLIVVFDYQKSSNDEKVAFQLKFQTYDCNMTCQNGRCLHPHWICNNINDCGDNTDEVNCSSHPIPPTPEPKPKTKEKNNTGIVVACFFIGLILGAALLFVIPRLVRRLRRRDGNYSRMGDERGPVVT